MQPGSRSALDMLLADRPTLHYDQQHDWSLGAGVLELIAERVEPGWRAIETGCGYSTILLAAAKAEVVTIAPSPFERAAIGRWCEAAGISLETVRWEEACSQDVLPNLDLGVVDLALIDGAHAFPISLIDWFFAGRALRAGGLLLVDDVQLPGPALLNEFLRSEGSRWRAVLEVDQCAVFERVGSDPLMPDDDWVGQTWRSRAPHPRRSIAGLARRLGSAVRRGSATSVR